MFIYIFAVFSSSCNYLDWPSWPTIHSTQIRQNDILFHYNKQLSIQCIYQLLCCWYRPWVFNTRPACLHYEAHVNICKLCTYKKKLYNNLSSYLYLLLLFFHVLPANQTTITNVDLCHKKFGDPRFRLKICCYYTDISKCLQHIFRGPG
jgi:hypothetical protein